ncbi:LysR family transcriptional regulator [Azospirillum cavernae]|uniref:LysR family transcriptional regulator n=1 Tax=Azospirillum cavernae TaxID=2320860 RepID=A0A418W1X0_9PROT|nr:LysR family transcriptional regulator [Azospirillum cavernae]RJF84020.1 LysR family transcriptional regulator [Azospirillum cavernae]
MPRLPLTALAAFEAAARHGGMTRAADDLGLTHGAVSRQVGDLEKRLGVRLFDRTPRGLLLTDAGRELARACTSGLGRMTEAWDRVASGGPQRLRVAAPRAWAALWLVPRLPRFLADWPGLRVDLDGSNHDRPAEAEAGWVVVRYVRGGDHTPDGITLSEEPLLPVCAPDMAERLRQPSDLLDGVTLLHVHEWPDWSVWKAAAGLDALDVSGGVSFSDSVMAMQAAEAGLGVALARPSLVLSALNAGRLVCPFGPAAPCGDRYVLSAPGAGQARRLPLAFRSWLLAEAEEDRRRPSAMPFHSDARR